MSHLLTSADEERLSLLEVEAAFDGINCQHTPGWHSIGTRVTSPTVVYRIEFPNGHGPFNSGTPDAEHIYNHLARLGCVTLAAKSDEKCGISDAAFELAHGGAEYGCASLAGIKAWFSAEARLYLSSLGATLWQYEVPVGDYILAMPNGDEVVFNLTSARKVGALPLADLA